MKKLTFEFVRIHPKAIIPEKTLGNLAFDLSVIRDTTFYQHNYPGKPDDWRYNLLSGERKLFHTGLKIAIPNGHGVVLRDRSGMAVKSGIHVLAGVIDSSYRGEWMICLLNTSDRIYEIIEGDRIAQAIVIEEYKMVFNENKELDATERGEKGFGHSGR